MQAVLIAPDIECDGCASSIQKSLTGIDGVQSVAVDVVARRIAVEFDPQKTGRSQIAARLDEIGFPTHLDA